MKLNKLLVISTIPMFLLGCSSKREHFITKKTTFEEMAAFYESNKDGYNPDLYRTYFEVEVYLLNYWKNENHYSLRITNPEQTLALYTDPILIPNSATFEYVEHERICIEKTTNLLNIENITLESGRLYQARLSKVYEVSLDENNNVSKYYSSYIAIELLNNN